MFEITGQTKQLGLIGKPIEHSFSPQMHNYISEIMGNNYVYSAWEVENVEDAIKGIRALGIKGINVTAPYKQVVMQYLDKIDFEAKLFDSVNTVVNNNGVLTGYSTDGEGFYKSLLRNNVSVKNNKILILGVGGVVSPVILRLIKENPLSITVLNRTKSKAENLKRSVFEKSGFKISTEINEPRFDLVINTTSAGMTPQLDKMPTDIFPELKNFSFIDENTFVADMIYNPSQTLFLKKAKERGAKTMNGLGMLIYQGIVAYELFTNTKLPDDIYDMIEKNVFNIDGERI